MKQKLPTGLFVIFDELPDSGLVRLNQLLSTAVIPFSAATVWRKVRDGTFPQPVRVSTQVTAWRVGEIRKWLKCPGHFCTDCARRKGAKQEPKKERVA